MRMARFDRPDDSLDIVELQMAIEEALGEKIQHLSLEAREQLIREILDRPDCDDFWNDDDTSAILVRKLGPKGPKGHSSVAVRPEVEPDEIVQDDPKFYAPRRRDSLGDTPGV